MVIFQRIREWRIENEQLGLATDLTDTWNPEQRERFFGLFVISIHKVYSILVKHAFSDNSNLFPIASTSKQSQVLGISADFRIIIISL